MQAYRTYRTYGLWPSQVLSPAVRRACWTPPDRPAIIGPMRDYHLENLSHDPIHGYIPFTSGRGVATRRRDGT